MVDGHKLDVRDLGEGLQGMFCPLIMSDCRGVECMMWREDSKVVDVGKAKGYCGLAGEFK